jgi:hypothetical protein
MYLKQSERVMSDNRKRWLKLAQRLVTYDTEDELIQVAGITIRELADRVKQLEVKNKRLLDCYDITASVSAMERAKDFNYWAGSALTWTAVKKLAEHFSVLEGAQT